jgi:hypothetical protein
MTDVWQRIRKLKIIAAKTEGKYYFFGLRHRSMSGNKYDGPESVALDMPESDGYIVQGWPQDRIVAPWYGENEKQ